MLLLFDTQGILAQVDEIENRNKTTMSKRIIVGLK
ncbi:hypothetical protein BPO_1616 [Bergeyella porcorum]|uniref:Hydrolase n=1 Tax=Bergeyella porcorum TaxID=1735111 RepID=A0AAU0F678_9FLAO